MQFLLSNWYVFLRKDLGCGFMISDISVLSREVSALNYVLKVATEKLNGAEYAFYFVCKGQVEKRRYSASNEVEFNLEPNVSFFSIVFYYRFENGQISSLRIDYFRKGGEVRVAEYDTIYETEDNKIIHYDLGAETTFIVFNGTKSTKKSIPFGLSFLLSRGCNVIACLQDNDTQYQSLSFEDFRTAVLPHVEGRKAICYGSSLGGYCAIYYAGAINASVIAAAPRNSAHPDLVKKKKGKSRFSPSLYKHKSIGGNELTRSNVVVILDPYYLTDVSFYRKYIRRFYKNSIRLIEIPHSGHEVLYYLTDTHQLEGLIFSLIDEKTYEINTNLDSKYTDIGLAGHWLAIGDTEKARFFARRAKNAGGLREKFEKRVNAILANFK
ncbi:MAG: hypothetical protein ACTHXJ_07670 [Mesonia sp.]